MDYVVLEEEAEAFVASLRERNQEAQQVRESTPGFHASGLLNHMLQTAQPATGRARDDDPTLRFEMGYVWEDLLGSFLFRSEMGQTPMETAGIITTLDDFDIELWEVREFKATWSSLNQPLRNRWYWLHQMRAYCYVTGALSSLLAVFFINGDWRPPAPQVKLYRFFWKQWELDQTWRMLVQHRAWLLEQGFDRI